MTCLVASLVCLAFVAVTSSSALEAPTCMTRWIQLARPNITEAVAMELQQLIESIFAGNPLDESNAASHLAKYLDFRIRDLPVPGHTISSCLAKESAGCRHGPCQNGGLCLHAELRGVPLYQCQCPAAYTGQYCELDTNTCHSSPCLNNGDCLTTQDGFKCICQSLYTGQRCQTEWWSELALGGLEENVLALTAKIADLQQQTISGHRQNADRVGTYLHELRNKLSASSKRMEATLNSMTADLRQDNHQIRIDNSQLKTTVTQLEAAANEARQRQNALVNLCRSLQGQVTSLSNRIKKLETASSPSSATCASSKLAYKYQREFGRRVQAISEPLVTMAFKKTRDDTVLRITASVAIGMHEKDTQWRVQIDGSDCVFPLAYTRSYTIYRYGHMPITINGVCERTTAGGIGIGSHNLTLLVGRARSIALPARNYDLPATTFTEVTEICPVES